VGYRGRWVGAGRGSQGGQRRPGRGEEARAGRGGQGGERRPGPGSQRALNIKDNIYIKGNLKIVQTCYDKAKINNSVSGSCKKVRIRPGPDPTGSGSATLALKGQ